MVTTLRVPPMLEIHEPAGAFGHIEDYLRAEGFFEAGGARATGKRADVYLGYGLSAASSRLGRKPPTEPIKLPLAACQVREAAGTPMAAGHFRVGAWSRTWESAQYAEAVAAVRTAIAEGEVYQVNLVQHMWAPFEGDPNGPSSALASLRPLVTTPLRGADWAIVSGSPEPFLTRQGRRLWTNPIKGTRPLGEAAELSASPKDAAEHVMIVDLERNDLGRVCEPGSVYVKHLMEARSMAGVEHLVSHVEGTLHEGASWADVMASMFPGGSVTGAPKIAAIDHIAALEPVGRGASMGALGTIWPNGDFELALTIRTFAIAAGQIHFWVGGGVVWDSRPEAEVEESWVKARPLLARLEAASRASV